MVNTSMFERKPLREEVQKEILARIFDGRLPQESRINETHLADDMGISRTPLREAMLHLEASGFLDSDMGRGWLVPPMSSTRFLECLAILVRLIPLSLESSAPFEAGLIMELNNLVSRTRVGAGLAGEQAADAVAGLVSRWTHLMTETCANETLRKDSRRLSALSRPGWREAGLRSWQGDHLVTGFRECYEMLRAGRMEPAGHAWAALMHSEGQSAARYLT